MAGGPCRRAEAVPAAIARAVAFPARAVTLAPLMSVSLGGGGVSGLEAAVVMAPVPAYRFVPTGAPPQGAESPRSRAQTTASAREWTPSFS